ncbi:hypothetical protein CCR75_002763 [Bremia lactucae]|uniref:FYVE-type domain-containing protein n=1 Tax=Bremia lactucae TaxID=4779 RepID=A0A976NY33_BRELC|nr:hypothetical protein CCR75_002763 [Bremia lactucae]
MNEEQGSVAPGWMQEQAAEYQDLVGSFVDSVVDSDTDEIIEYQLIWEGGDLGVALTTIEGGNGGVAVSRVTGKGFPFGIKNVGPGDLLLSINMKVTTKMTLDDVVAYLQVCDLPATLRFKKLSPTTDQVPISVPRKSTYVITSDNGPTSPMGSQPPASYPRGSTKAVPPTSVPADPDRSSMPVHEVPSEFSEPPAAPQRQSAKVPVNQQVVKSPPRPQSMPISEPVVYTDKHEEHLPTAAAPKPLKQKLAMPQEEMPSELDDLVLTSGVNDLGFDDSEDESVRLSSESRDSWRDESFDVDMKHEEEKDNAMLEETQNDKKISQQQTLRESDSRVAMLKHLSSNPKKNAKTVLPDADEATSVAVVDNESDFMPENHQSSPLAGSKVRPSDLSSSTVSSLSSSMNNTDGPRPSVRVTMDSTAPMLKSHAIGTMHEMCAKGNLRGVVQYLRVEGPEALINREPNHGQTGLHLAVKSGKVSLVKVILEQYSPIEDIINVEDDKGNTALHFAATKTPAMVHLLLENGASANVKNSRKLTPLIISVITSKDDSVIISRMLLKFGANPNDMHDSQTVIHTAISSVRLHIAGALVRAGAKMDVEDAEGKSVFEKLPRKDLRFLISHIYFPPTYITKKERSECMLCHQKFKFGFREHNCTHCGRLCCAECSALHVEMYRFPLGFPGRTRRGAANREQKRVCKTCYNVFKERNEEPEKSDVSKFINRVINIEWDEVNPEKLQTVQEAGRRG